MRCRWPLVLVVGSLAAGAIGCLAVRTEKQRRQQESFAKLKASGGVFGWDGADKYYGVNLDGCPVGDEDLALVEDFDDFDHVSISRTRVSDAGVRHLRGLSGLHLLYMSDTKVGDEGIEALSALRQLKALDLSGTRVTNSGLRHLTGMTQLEWLSLSRTRVSDAGVAYLRRLPALRSLHVDGTDLSAQGIADLQAAIPGLRVNPVGD